MEVAGEKRNWWAKAFNTAVLQEKRLHWVDYLRGLAIILIVYRHVLIGIQRAHIEVANYLVQANMVFYSFRMPLFFILSGIFISKSLKKNSPGKLAGIKFENLVYPYLIWTFIQISLQIALNPVTNSNRSFIDYSYIFYQPRNLDQFWYLPALFNATMVFMLLKVKVGLTSWMQLVFGIILYFVSPYFQGVSMISDWMAFYFFFALGDAISDLMFRKESMRIFRNNGTLLVLIPVFFLSQWYYLAHHFDEFIGSPKLSSPNYFTHITDQVSFILIALIGCFSMFILAFRMQEWKILPFLRVIGFHSLYIYVMHVIVTASIRLSLIIFFHVTNPLIILGASIAFGVTVPIIFYNMLIKDGPLWFLFYYHKKTDKAARKNVAVQPSEVRLSSE